MKLPDLPEEIRNAVNNHQLVIFAGAGISQQIGYPSWDELTSKMLSKCLEDKKIDFNRFHLLDSTEFKDNRILLSIIHEHYGDDSLFNKRISELLKYKPAIKKNNLVKTIVHYGVSIVTTNYDKSFEYVGKHYHSYTSCNAVNPPLKSPYVVHLHGSIGDGNSIIQTMVQYDDLYYRQADLVREVLSETLGQAEAVLFLGYSLSEREIISQIRYDNKEGKYFLLKGFFPEQAPLIESFKKYYDSINVKLIDYIFDETGYDRLTDIVVKWLDDSVMSGNLRSKQIMAIQAAIDLDDPSTGILEIAKIIRIDEDCARFFLRSIFDREDIAEWVGLLISKPDLAPFWDNVKESEVLLQIAMRLFYKCKIRYGDWEKVSDYADTLQIVVIRNICNGRKYPDNVIDAALGIGVDFSDGNRAIYIQAIQKMRTRDRSPDSIIARSITDYCHYRPHDADRTAWLTRNVIVNCTSERTWYMDAYIAGMDRSVIVQYGPQGASEIVDGIMEVVDESHINQSPAYLFLNTGTVENALKGPRTRRNGILRIFEQCIPKLQHEYREHFVSTYLKSDNRSLKLLALHMINKRFKELKHPLLDLDEFKGLNYPELYDLLNNNASELDLDEIGTVRDTIQNTEFETDHQLNDRYRNDLLKLLPGYVAPREQDQKQPLPTEYVPSISARGDHSRKQPEDVPHFSNLEEFGQYISAPGRNISATTRGLVALLSSDPSILKNEFDQLLEVPIEYHPGIAEAISRSEYATLDQFRRLLLKTLELDPDRLRLEIYWFDNWPRNNRLDNPDIAKMFIDIVSTGMSAYFQSDASVDRYGLIQDVYNRWFPLMVYHLIPYVHQVQDSRLCSDLGRLMTAICHMEDSAAKAQTYAALLMHYHKLKNMGYDMDGEILEGILTSVYAPAVSLLYIATASSDEAIGKILDSVPPEDLFSKQALDWVGGPDEICGSIEVLLERYLNGKGDYYDVLVTLSKTFPQDYFDTVLRYLTETDNASVDRTEKGKILKTIIDITSGIDCSLWHLDCAARIMAEECSEETVKLFMKMLRKTDYIGEGICRFLLSDTVERAGILVDAVSTVVFKKRCFYDRAFKDVVRKVKDFTDRAKFNRIVNTMIGKGHSEYYDLNCDDRYQ